MPLSDFLSLTDDTLREQFEAKPVDKTAIRKPFKKALQAAIKQFEEGRTKAPNRMWTANGDTVKFTPKLKGQPLAISDKTELFIPSERFVEALNKLIANVDAGELDDLLTEGSTPSAKPTKQKFPKELRSDWDSLSRGEKQSIGSLWNHGKNPDLSERSKVGDKPDAPYAGATSKAAKKK
ncbi:MAG: hypothetical protein AABZ76_16320 [Pseudomonadota bacterium]